ncbi:lasso peptide biosynthesis PqqD family chaperone [Priestia aryabhattai]|uniref:lasso peptide biosynthesis PqqD family chaperone n=1 Tax=Priestia aryabhattai TaxID=412384 RepID=UPI001CCEED4D|nr:lasso peptide biosynthesis PqqD family chaperone [Priestia aryabhattai]MBZ6489046.1 lasso peptide biosynthesis PqqD family chaperone [Priestia aryabhattai]
MKKIQPVSINCTVMQSEGNIVSDMDGEKVMMSVGTGKYYNLGVMGGEIWGAIQSTTSVKDIVTHLMSVYEVEANVCESEVLSFLEVLYKEGLIQVQDEVHP